MCLRKALFLGGLLTALALCLCGEQAVLADGTYIGPYGQSLGGKQGKNICAADDDTLIVVYCRSYGQPNNPYHLWVAYSYDGGEHWENAISSIGPGPGRRFYPGVTSPRDNLNSYLAYQHAVHDGTTYVSSDLYFSYDEFFPFMLYTPCLVATGHWWFASIITTSSGGTVLISAADKNHAGATNNAYVFRSTNGGVSWPEPPVLMIDTQGNPDYEDLDSPRMVLGEGGYVFALFNWKPVGSYSAIPHYLESLDYGATWSEPDTLLPDWSPNPKQTCSWYCFDCILNPDHGCRPHCTVRLAGGMNEFGDVWEVHPTQGSPGSWSNWTQTLLAGDGRLPPCASTPSIGRDPWGNLHVVYEKWFPSGPDTFPDIGYRYSTDSGTTWGEELRITDNPSIESPVELADNVFDHLYILYASRDSLFFFEYPNALVGVEESPKSRVPIAESQLFQNYPNPFSHSTTIHYHVQGSRGAEEQRGDLSTYERINLSIYDLAGRIVKTLVDGSQSVTSYELPVAVRWDGRNEDGALVAAGVYLYCLNVGSCTETRKLVVLR